jgi:HEAT repeat protein
MKNMILTLILLGAAMAHGQNAKRDSLAREVDEYVLTVNQAASQFLNKTLSPAERIKAIEPHAVIYDEKQVEQFKNVVLDNEEPPEIRAMALNKIYAHVPEDERLGKLELEWLGDTKAPKVLRQEALQLAANLSFSSNMGVLDVYQKLLDDPDLQFRVFAFTKLIIHGDARAQQKLIAGLENPETALLPEPTAIGILSMAVKKEYLPAVYKVFQQTQDEATRLEAIRVLGNYKEARDKLITISRDPKEKEEFREAALGALYAGDSDNVVQYITPILSDKSAPARLQAIAIQMAFDVRQSMAYRTKTSGPWPFRHLRKADDLDKLIKSIAEDKTPAKNPELDKVANNYLQSVRPNY